MPFYIRKSVKAGPFRFNLSKSGIGVSAGIKGLRIGTGPRGHYIHAGRGGLYYRSSIPSGHKTARPRQPPTSPQRIEPGPPSYTERDVEMLPVSSGSVLEMADARFAEVLADLNAKQNSLSMRSVLGWSGGAIALLATFAGGPGGIVFGVSMLAAGLLVGGWLDSFRRTSVLMYDLEDETRIQYEHVTAAFDALAACVGKWHIDSGGAVLNIHAWKRNAGAGHVVDRRVTSFSYSLPRVVTSNITPPSIQSGKETLYFLPDFLLVVESGKVGAVAYDNLAIRTEESNFIEDGTVPSDTEILWHTWKHPNKSGGPDRRFASNYQIPVCRYESIHLSSTNGLNELLQVSRAGVSQPFVRAIAALARVNGRGVDAEPLPQLT